MLEVNFVQAFNILDNLSGAILHHIGVLNLACAREAGSVDQLVGDDVGQLRLVGHTNVDRIKAVFTTGFHDSFESCHVPIGLMG